MVLALGKFLVEAPSAPLAVEVARTGPLERERTRAMRQPHGREAKTAIDEGPESAKCLPGLDRDLEIPASPRAAPILWNALGVRVACETM